jgi:hypothetical protein
LVSIKKAQIEISPISKENMETTEQAQIPEVADQAVETHEKKTPQESFAELRKAKEDAERQAWQAKKELELYQQQLRSQQVQQMQPKEEEFDFRQLEKEEFPNGEKIFKAFGKIDKKLSSYEQKLSEKDSKILALEFAIEHPDLKDVITAENIEKYIQNDEDNAETVKRAENPLKKAYNLIKKSAAYQADIASRQPKPISQEQKRVDEKDTKPKTGSMGVRSEAVTVAAQMSNSKMTKEQKIALWKETQTAARR